MAENNLFQLAQVVTELPMHHHPSSSPMSRPNEPHSALLPRKNACIVCAICFTCSGYYGANCQCSEIQPRRGKNLPEGGLDSRAKKLLPNDKDDYEFTLKWLNESAHQIYRDKSNHIVGLSDMTEVSLCKAHSSTLYRAKKKHLRTTQDQAPPSPADSNEHHPDYHPSYTGTLAAKVHNTSYQQTMFEPPDFMMTTSTSTKRKRTNTLIPSSSISTPLFTAKPPSSQLPPLHLRTPSLTSLSSNLQQQLSFNQRSIIPPPPYSKVVETVSLKSSSQEEYYIQNLAITDTYTFRDLLTEIDFAGTPPPGKRIVISDEKRERTFPLNQPIRSVIRYPSSTHVEFYLGLSDKPSIDWSSYI